MHYATLKTLKANSIKSKFFHYETHKHFLLLILQRHYDPHYNAAFTDHSLTSIWLKQCVKIIFKKDRAIFIKEYTRHVKYKEWKLSSLLARCAKKKVSILYPKWKKPTSLDTWKLETSRWRVYSIFKKSPPVKANARTFDIIKRIIIIVILILMNLAVNYCEHRLNKNKTGISALLLGHNNIYESESGSASFRTGLSLQDYNKPKFRQQFISIFLCQAHDVFYWMKETSCQAVPILELNKNPLLYFMVLRLSPCSSVFRNTWFFFP